MIARILRGCALAALILSPSLTLADGTGAAESIIVEAPWARASIGTSRPGAAYMIIRNEGGAPVTLIELQTHISAMTQIHETTTDANGVSRMSRTGKIEIPAKGSVTLAPGGMHAMLMRLQAPMQKGETFPLTLVFERGMTVTVEVPILAPGASGPAG